MTNEVTTLRRLDHRGAIRAASIAWSNRLLGIFGTKNHRLLGSRDRPLGTRDRLLGTRNRLLGIAVSHNPLKTLEKTDKSLPKTTLKTLKPFSFVG